MLYFDHVTCYFNQDNKRTNIEYNINYIEVLKWSRDNSSSCCVDLVLTVTAI